MLDQPGRDFDQIPAPEAPQKNLYRKWIRLGVTVLLLMCLCVNMGARLFNNSIRETAQEEANVVEVLNSFMEEMEAQEFDAAYSLFSSRAQGQFGLEEIIEGMEGSEGSNFALFDGYQDIQIKTLVFRTAFNTDPNQAQGKVADVEGFVLYENEVFGTLTAILEKEDGVWRLHYIDVVAPEEKFENYNDGQEDI